MVQKACITVYPDTGEAFGMTFYVPVERDVEEYICEKLEEIFSRDFSYADWDFD